MSKRAIAVLSVLACAAIASFLSAPLLAADAQAFLNAEKWQVDYEMTFTASSNGSYKSLQGPLDYTTALEQVHSASIPLDLRSQGPAISMSLMTKTQDPSKMSVAEIQKFSMELANKTEHTANWMHGGAGLMENATDEEIEAAARAETTTPNGSGRINYERVETGNGLTTEMGSKYNSRVRTTRTGTAKIIAPYQVRLEVDASAKSYLLGLGTSFADVETDSVTEETHTHLEFEGEAPTDSTAVNRYVLSSLPGRITVDDPEAVFGQELILKGTFDPSAGKITGEHKVAAHYAGYMGDIPGTLLVKFTLTPK